MDDNSAVNNDIESIIESEVERHNDSQNVSEEMSSSSNVNVTEVCVTLTANNHSNAAETATKTAF